MTTRNSYYINNEEIISRPLMTKTTTLWVHSLFNISSPTLHEYDVSLKAAFAGFHNAKPTDFFFKNFTWVKPFKLCLCSIKKVKISGKSPKCQKLPCHSLKNTLKDKSHAAWYVARWPCTCVGYKCPKKEHFLT